MSRYSKATRRCKIYGSRAMRTLPMVRELKRNIAFMHMPKCAGTSLSNALYGLVPLHKRVGVIDANATRLAAGIMNRNVMDRLSCHEDREYPAPCFKIREEALLTHMCWDTPLIHGHFLWSDKAYAHFDGRYDFLSMLRNPIERALSNFKMNKARGIVEPDMSIDEWIESPLGFHHGSTYLRYFSGKSQIAQIDANKILPFATKNAEKFTLIGCVEKQEEFADNFADIYGIRLTLGRYNQAEISDLGLSKKQADKLENLCEFDKIIYDRFANWANDNE